jgi:hypothetical protein
LRTYVAGRTFAVVGAVALLIQPPGDKIIVDGPTQNIGKTSKDQGLR